MRFARRFPPPTLAILAALAALLVFAAARLRACPTESSHQLQRLEAMCPPHCTSGRGAAIPKQDEEAFRNPDACIRRKVVADCDWQGWYRRKAIGFLLEALHDPDAWVRAMAAVVIRDWANERVPEAKQALDALKTLLDDPEIEVRRHAAFALVAILPPGDARGAPAVPILRDLLAETDAVLREPAESSLAHLGPVSAPILPDLRRLLREGDDALRARAATLLQSLGAAAKEALPELRSLLRHPSAAVRGSAARALGFLGGDAAVAIPDLVAALDDPDLEVEHGAAESLARLGGPTEKAVALVRKHLRERTQFYEWLPRLLGRFGKEAAPALIEGLSHADRLVRDDCREQLESIREIPTEAIPALLATIGGQDARSTYACLACLGRMGKDATAAISALDGMVEAWKSGGSAGHGAILFVVVMTARIDPTRQDRAREALARAVADGDGSDLWAVAELVRRGLAEPDAAWVPVLSRRLEAQNDDSWWAARTLVAIGPRIPEALGPVIRLLEDPDPKRAGASASDMGRLKSVPEALGQALLRVLESRKEGMVESACAHSLLELGWGARIPRVWLDSIAPHDREVDCYPARQALWDLAP